MVLISGHRWGFASVSVWWGWTYCYRYVIISAIDVITASPSLFPSPENLWQDFLTLARRSFHQQQFAKRNQQQHHVASHSLPFICIGHGWSFQQRTTTQKLFTNDHVSCHTNDSPPLDGQANHGDKQIVFDSWSNACVSTMSSSTTTSVLWHDPSLITHYVDKACWCQTTVVQQ